MRSAPLNTSTAPTPQLASGLTVPPDHGGLIQLLDQTPLRLTHYLVWLLSSGMIGVSFLGLLSTWPFRVDDRAKTLEAHQAPDLP
jgi:hypothetical protein